MIESIAGVFALAILEMWAAIPLGFHLKLHPALLVAATVSGALLGVLAATLLGDGLRRLVFWRKKDAGAPGRVSAWLMRKGPWAIGLLGPLLVGPLFAAGLAAALGLPRRLTLGLLACGIVLWTCAFTLLGVLGKGVLA